MGRSALDQKRRELIRLQKELLAGAWEAREQVVRHRWFSDLWKEAKASFQDSVNLTEESVVRRVRQFAERRVQDGDKIGSDARAFIEKTFRRLLVFFQHPPRLSSLSSQERALLDLWVEVDRMILKRAGAIALSSVEAQEIALFAIWWERTGGDPTVRLEHRH